MNMVNHSTFIEEKRAHKAVLEREIEILTGMFELDRKQVPPDTPFEHYLPVTGNLRTAVDVLRSRTQQIAEELNTAHLDSYENSIDVGV
jgi:hypothetical protein